MEKKKGRRITVSLTELVTSWAEEMCAQKGYDNFSAYIADLIRRDKERHDERTGKTVYPSNTEQSIRIEDEKPRPEPRQRKTFT